LTDSGRFTHKVVKQPSINLAQDRESSPARTDVLTTMLHHQLTLPACGCQLDFCFFKLKICTVVFPVSQIFAVRSLYMTDGWTDRQTDGQDQ